MLWLTQPSRPRFSAGGAALASLLIQRQHAGASGSESQTGYSRTLHQTRDALRREAFDEAEHVLRQAGPIAGDDAAFLNLAGVLHECRGRHAQACKCYGRAIRSDRKYAPAQQNMRRLYELKTFGHTREVVALGDELDENA